MNKEFIPYEQALELKQLGFDETCFRYYTKHGYLDDYTPIGLSAYFGCHAPLYQQAFRFFREKYGCSGIVEGSKKDGYEWCIYPDEDFYVKNPNNSNTYEEAEHACLLKLISICKENNNDRNL